MLKSILGLLGPLAMLCALPGNGFAQANHLEGKWSGSLLNWPYDNGNGSRELVVENGGSCRWDLAGKPTGPSKAKSCTVSEHNGVVRLELKTGADSTVNLSLREGVLDGGFQLKGGGTMYRITLKRTP